MPASLISCNYDRETTELGQIEAPKPGDSGGGRYTVRYKVQMSAACGPITVIGQGQAAGGANDTIPTLWSTYSFQGDTDSGSYVKTIRVDRDPGSAFLYYVTVNYEPAEPGEIPDTGGAAIGAQASPTSQKAFFWWDRETVSNVKLLNKDGYPALNKAMLPYEDIVEHDEHRSILVVEFNVANQTQMAALTSYQGSVNQSVWGFRGTNYPARSILVRDVVSTPTLSQGYIAMNGSTPDPKAQYTHAVMRFAVTTIPGYWDESLPELSQFHYTKDSNGYVLENGFRKRTDAGCLVPINDDGTRRSEDQPVLVTSHRIRKETDFNQLPFMSLLT